MDWFSHLEALAPGDSKSGEFNNEGVSIISVDSTQHPYFQKAFQALWTEFGEKAEIESQEVIESRFDWQGRLLTNGFRYHYQMLWIEKEGQPVGVRDHTVIYHQDFERVIVHLSHNLIFPEFRRTGFAGWMRAFPLIFAQEFCRQNELSIPITLAAEMEPMQKGKEDRLPRLLSVEKAGFLKVDGFDYQQPDFRNPMEIDRMGGVFPLPMSLILRRVGSEVEHFLSGLELAQLVSALYSMYGESFRSQDMVALKRKIPEINLQKNYALILPKSSF